VATLLPDHADLAARGLPLAARVGTGEPDGDALAPIVMRRAPSGLYSSWSTARCGRRCSGETLPRINY
jgi:hypothetical protein